jgi:probable phosphoglycerate mutase
LTDATRTYSLDELARAPEPRVGLARTFFSIGSTEGATELLLVRHGQIPETRTIQEDPHLTEIGRAQAAALADHLAGRPIAAIYASPSLRTRETAAPIAARHGLEVVIDHNLRDVESYLQVGQTLRDVVGEEKYEEMLNRFAREKTYDVWGETRESGQQLRDRMAGAIDAVVAAHREGRVVIVGHGPPIQAYLAGLLGSRFDMLVATRLTAVSVIWAKGELRDVAVINSTAHFGGF